jgi:hypothetical protein
LASKPEECVWSSAHASGLSDLRAFISGSRA